MKVCLDTSSTCRIGLERFAFRVWSQMILVPHQATGLHLGVQLHHRPARDRKEGVPVVRVEEEVFRAVTTRSDAVRRSGERDSKRAGHAGEVRHQAKERGRRDPSDPVLISNAAATVASMRKKGLVAAVP